MLQDAAGMSLLLAPAIVSAHSHSDRVQGGGGFVGVSLLLCFLAALLALPGFPPASLLSLPPRARYCCSRVCL